MGSLPPAAVERLTAVHSGERTESRFASRPHAFHVFGVRHRFKVLRVAAQASLAKMVDVQTWLRTTIQFVGQPVSRILQPANSAVRQLDLPITFVSRTRPGPALVWRSLLNSAVQAQPYVHCDPMGVNKQAVNLKGG